MSTTNKNKSLVIVVIILLLTNIAMLAFILCNKPGGKRGPRGGDREAMVKTFLQKELGFSKEQMARYDTLNEQQKRTMKARFDELRSNRMEVYKVLGQQDFADSALENAAVKLSDNQKDMELNLLNHFAAIRKIGTAEQQAKFDSLFYTIWNKRDDKRRKQD